MMSFRRWRGVYSIFSGMIRFRKWARGCCVDEIGSESITRHGTYTSHVLTTTWHSASERSATSSMFIVWSVEVNRHWHLRAGCRLSHLIPWHCTRRQICRKGRQYDGFCSRPHVVRRRLRGWQAVRRVLRASSGSSMQRAGDHTHFWWFGCRHPMGSSYIQHRARLAYRRFGPIRVSLSSARASKDP